MKLHIRTEESTSGFWIFKTPSFDLIFRLEMTEEEFTAYNKMQQEIFISGSQYTSDRTYGETTMRSSLHSMASQHDEYEWNNLNPTVDYVVKHARKGVNLRFKCKTRGQLRNFQYSLEEGVKDMSSRLKDIIKGLNNGSKTVEF